MLRFLVFCLLLLSLSACTVSDRVVYEDSEGVVPESFFSSIKKNKTKRVWIVDNLGEPRSVQSGENEAQFYSYHLKRSHYRKASFLFVMRYQGSAQDSEYFHVMMCGETVKKSWWDSFAVVQLDTELKRSKCPKIEHSNEKMAVENMIVKPALMEGGSVDQEGHSELQELNDMASSKPVSIDEQMTLSEKAVSTPVVTTEDL